MSLVEWLRLQWDRLAAWVCVALGLVALVLGYVGISGTVYPAEQLPYILSGGIFGVFALGLGAMLWLSADVRDEWRKLDVLEEKLDAIDAILRRGDRPLRARWASAGRRPTSGALDRRVPPGSPAEEADGADSEDDVAMGNEVFAAAVPSGTEEHRRPRSDGGGR
jgi:hypothetical protein